MKQETAAALIEMMKLAIKHTTGKEPDGPIVVTVCRDKPSNVNNCLKSAARCP